MDKVSREMSDPKALKDIVDNETEADFITRKERLMKGEGLKSMMKQYNTMKEIEALLDEFAGVTKNIPRSKFTEMSNKTGLEDAMIAAICETLELERKAQNRNIQ